MELFLSALKWSAVVGGAALVLTLARGRLERRYSAKWRYWAWLVLAALLLTAPLFTLLPERVEPIRPPVVIQLPAPERTAPPAEEQITVQAPTEPREQAPTQTVESAAKPAATVSVEELVPILWTVGGVAFALYHLVGTAWFSRRACRWSRPAGEETQETYAALAAELGIKNSPRLAVSGKLDSPVVLGVLRPRLLLPGEDFGGEELDFVLRHELTHYKRRDLWYKLLLLTANAVHWFNPLIYLLRRQAEADLELTCDDAVVAGCGRETRKAYSETLLKSLHRQSALGRAALSSHFYGGAKVMRDRFRNILTGNGRKWGVAALAVALIATVAVACVFGFQYGAEARPLTAEELKEWEEKLNTPEWNVYTWSNAYSDIKEFAPSLQLNDYFYTVEWPEDWEKETPPPVEELAKQNPNDRIFFVTRKQVDQFLREHTGLGLKDYPNGFGPGLWTYLEEYDGYLARGMGKAIGVSECMVLGGARRGDVITLEVVPRPSTRGAGKSSEYLRRTLTIVDGKVKSFTSDQEIQVEKLAFDVLKEELQKVETRGAKVERRYLTGIRSNHVDQFEIEGKFYTIWLGAYDVQVDDPSKVPEELGLMDYGGWLWQFGPTALVVSKDQAGAVALLGTLPHSQWKDFDDQTWEEYIVALVSGGDGPMPLTRAELDAWQEKLNSSRYNGFVTRMYTDVRNLPLSDLLYSGAGIAVQPRDTERTLIEDHWGYAPEAEIHALPRIAVENYLLETTGYELEQFASGMDGWTYLEQFDRYYHAHGDTNWVSDVEVVGGTRAGDQLNLEIQLPAENGSGMTEGTMVVRNGLVRSFTNPAYTAAEALAMELLEDACQLAAASGAGTMDSYLSELYCVEQEKWDWEEDTDYSWAVGYRIRLVQPEKVEAPGYLEKEGDWLVLKSDWSHPGIIVSVNEEGKLTSSTVYRPYVKE